MNKTFIGILFILAGLIYGSTTIDKVNDLTIGWLIKNGWLNKPPAKPESKNELSPKVTIIIFSLILIIIGIFILWNRTN